MLVMGRPIILEDGHDFDEAAAALEMTVLCREFHVLPGSGGLLDQDSYHVWLLSTGVEVLNRHEERQAKEQRQKIESEAKKVRR